MILSITILSMAGQIDGANPKKSINFKYGNWIMVKSLDF